MNGWLNFIGYQLVWFAVVGTAGSRPWLGLAAAVGFIALQVAISERRALDVRLAILALVFGLAIDGTLSELGWVRYAAPTPALGGGPIAYWSAARGFHAVRFVPSSYRGVAGLAAGWSAAMTVLFYTVRRCSQNAAPASSSAGSS
jgi:hypothetical protein